MQHVHQKLWPLFIATIFFTVTAFATSYPIFLDFSNGDTSVLDTNSQKRCISADKGIVPALPRSSQWKLVIADLPPFQLLDKPYLILTVMADDPNPLSINLDWKYKYRDGGSGSGHIATRSGYLPVLESHDIVIDLRRSFHGVMGQPDSISLTFATTGGNHTFPLLSSLSFASPDTRLMLTERWRRITVSDPLEQPYVVFILILSVLAIIILSAQTMNVTIYRNKKISFFTMQKIMVFCLMLIWSLQAGSILFSRLDDLMDRLMSPRQSSGSIRSRAYGDWCKTVFAAAEIIPETETVGIVTSRSDRKTLYRHLASYLLYPRPVTEDINADTIMMIDYYGMTSEAFKLITESGYRFLASVGGRNFIFTRTPSVESPLTEQPLIPKDPVITVCNESHRRHNILDGDLSTRWYTGHPMKQGDWLQVDLTEPQILSSVRCWHFGYWDDYPRGYRIELSSDAVNWHTVADVDSPFIAPGYVQASLPPIPVKHLRMIQTRSHPGCFWSVSELEFFTSNETGALK